jgi:hypothetical protein
MNMALPPYVEYGGLVSIPAPFKCEGTVLDAFFVKADGAKLDALCKRVFFDPSNGAVDYVALGDYVMLAWGDTRATSMLAEPAPPGIPWNARGGVREPQVCVWVPVAAVTRRAGKIRAHKFVWFLPFIWVDNAMSLATGRETHGYPKSFAKIGVPYAGSKAWTLDAFGLDYASQNDAALHPLMEVTQTGGFDEAMGDLTDGLLHLGKDIADKVFGTTDPWQALPDRDFIGSIFADILQMKMPQVFFKQVRSADGLGASLQQVIEAYYKITRIKWAPYPHLHQYKLTMHSLDSQPLFEQLGLVDQDVMVGYHVEMGFEVQGGKVLWERFGLSASGGNGHGGWFSWIPWLGRGQAAEHV